MSESGFRPGRHHVREFLQVMRPHQWIKNIVVFAGLVFGGVATNPFDYGQVVLTFVAFCLASSGVYILNDLLDRDRDRNHPIKRERPIAARRVSVQAAIIVGLLAITIGLCVSWFVGWDVVAVLAAYAVLLNGYSLGLKRVPVLDVGIIAIGFQLRAIAGAYAVEVPISPWLLLCTFLLSLFLGFAKRRNEMLVLGSAASAHRPALGGYSPRVLDMLIGFAAGSSILVYGIYSVVSTTAPRDSAMELSVPWVAIAIFRYCFLVYGKNLGGTPESLILRDRWLFLTTLAWGITVLSILRFT